MIRLCPWAPVFLAVSLGTFGCAGQNLQGRWLGPLPLEDAKECRTDLYANGRFNLVCRNDAWVGSGRWDAAGNHLRLEFSVLVRKGKVLDRPQPIEMTMEGRGNELRLRWRDLNLKWIRRF